ncbi:J domain-containing protein [Haloplanus aerogenes]|uniref:DnaJ-like protein n=1 Tax=Haloplanus aerogenes TaxID=660522 RepID=A0A3M0D346_9EURY|nr:J domain-containing protein [Haloplanus aerogenes]AZH25081.1 J domain-containing protein [Haloplanus aerogenes]RMB13699.1 DnaJ-like protein [Haloplanus aerogenes]
MLPEWVQLVPPWLLAGVAMGAAAVVLVAGIFVVGGRLFPSPPMDRGPRVDGTDRRRGEIRTYLDSIGERYVEDAAVHDDTVAFYLPDHEVAITFDPQAYFRIERAGTAAVLCEHEMPGHQLGRRLPFETPRRDENGVTSSTRIGTAFARLGLPPTAGADEVKRAYRRQVKNVHPDHGGDSESFKRLQDAYATAREHAD